jgi:hypothetical protein
MLKQQLLPGMRGVWQLRFAGCAFGHGSEEKQGRDDMNSGMKRREFLALGVCKAGMVAAGLAVLNMAKGPAHAAQSGANRFPYDVERFGKTDPKLIHFEQVAVIKSAGVAPRRLTIGAGDRLYVAAKEGILVFSPEGERVMEARLTAPARCVAVAEDGTIYAGVRDHVEVFNGKGQSIATWESPGGRAWFTGLAVSANDVFAADAGSRVVLRYDRSGKLQGRIGEKNKERNVPGLIVPSPYLDVDLGADGLLRVNNPGRHRVEVYTPNGDLELFWGKPGAAIEGFCGCCNPIGIGMMKDGRSVTCEKGLPRVKVYGAEGSFECVVAGPESFPENARTGSVHDLSDGSMGGLDAAVDSQGRVCVLDLVAASVRIMKRKVSPAA